MDKCCYKYFSIGLSLMLTTKCHFIFYFSISANFIKKNFENSIESLIYCFARCCYFSTSHFSCLVASDVPKKGWWKIEKIQLISDNAMNIFMLSIMVVMCVKEILRHSTEELLNSFFFVDRNRLKIRNFPDTFLDLFSNPMIFSFFPLLPNSSKLLRGDWTSW